MQQEILILKDIYQILQNINVLPNNHSKVISGCPTSPPKNEHNELRKATNAIKATTMAVIFRTNMAAVEAPVHKILVC